MASGLAKAYTGHFIDSFPGVNTAWLLLGMLEAVAFLVLIASLVTGEFLPHRTKPILLAGLGVSMFTFAVMTFAQKMVADHDSVASLFTYMGITAVIYALIRLVPPFRASAPTPDPQAPRLRASRRRRDFLEVPSCPPPFRCAS